MSAKVCIDCGWVLTRDAFYAKKDTRDGLSPYCKECQKRRSTKARELRKRLDYWYG